MDIKLKVKLNVYALHSNENSKQIYFNLCFHVEDYSMVECFRNKVSWELTKWFIYFQSTQFISLIELYDIWERNIFIGKFKLDKGFFNFREWQVCYNFLLFKLWLILRNIWDYCEIYLRIWRINLGEYKWPSMCIGLNSKWCKGRHCNIFWHNQFIWYIVYHIYVFQKVMAINLKILLKLLIMKGKLITI